MKRVKESVSVFDSVILSLWYAQDRRRKAARDLRDMVENVDEVLSSYHEQVEAFCRALIDGTWLEIIPEEVRVVPDR